MIELPAGVYPNAVEPALVDRGGVMRGATALRVNRLGSHYRMACSLPPLAGDMARVVVSRLLRAKRLGLRMPYPLLSISQGAPGAPVVSGAGQSGRTLNLRGLTPGYTAREGYWLSLTDASGRHYLHNVMLDAVAAANGTMQLRIDPELRAPFADGASVFLVTPMIEGLIDGDEIAWSLSLAHHTSIGFTIEEAR